MRAPRSTAKDIYPIKIGLMADVGQTENSTQTMEHMIANKPRVGEFTGAATAHAVTGVGTTASRAVAAVFCNMRRWSRVTLVTCSSADVQLSACCAWPPVPSRSLMLTASLRHSRDSLRHCKTQTPGCSGSTATCTILTQS